MANLQTTSAYNFERFEPKKREAIGRPELEVIRNENPRDRLAPLKLVCVLVLVVAIVATMIYNQVVLTEISAQISENRKQLELMQNEYNMMLMEVEGQTSERRLEEEAIHDYGLSRMQSYQVEYVNLTQGDKIESTGVGQESLLRRLYSQAAILLEYISGR